MAGGTEESENTEQMRHRGTEIQRQLLEKLADRRFANLPRALHANIAAYYARGAPAGMSRSERKRADQIQQWLVAMSR